MQLPLFKMPCKRRPPDLAQKVRLAWRAFRYAQRRAARGTLSSAQLREAERRYEAAAQAFTAAARAGNVLEPLE